MSSYSFVVIKVEYNIIVQKYIMRIENPVEYQRERSNKLSIKKIEILKPKP